MNRKFRAGIIGFGHMHINNVAGLFGAHPDVEWVACADTQPLCRELRIAPYTREWNRRKVIERGSIPAYYDDYRAMLRKERFDLMVVTSENAQHPEVVEACAEAGVHVCVEKPMAVSLSAANRMDQACRRAGAALAINWPTSFLPQVRLAARLVAEGAVGQVLEVRSRIGHTGPLGAGARHAGADGSAAPMTGPERAATWWHQSAAGGGAMLDFCCYGAKFSRWYIGEPATAALGLKMNLDSQWGDAEDNAAILVQFPRAMGVIQGSWTTVHETAESALVVYGSAGVMALELGVDQAHVCVERGVGSPPEVFECEPLPAQRANIAQEFIHHLKTGEPLHPTLTPEFNLEVISILDAAALSASSGRMENVSAVEFAGR